MISAATRFRKCGADRPFYARPWLPQPTGATARLLEVTPRAVQYWRRGERNPRSRNRMRLWALEILLIRAVFEARAAEVRRLSRKQAAAAVLVHVGD